MPSIRAQRLLRSIIGTSSSSAARSPWASRVTLPSQLVGDPSGQAQLLGGALGKVAEPHTLHISREMPAAADHTHASMPVTV